MTTEKRCAWVTDDPLYQAYHDKEWGRPVHDDRKLFEAVVLDAFQAGLSWLIVLKKRDHFRKAFDKFDPEKIARYNKKNKPHKPHDGAIFCAHNPLTLLLS